ncbi:AAA family ATPase [Variovorax saccharolyticus]|uniref:AAA family ATPase n=1 Tax=Variovorax saccharolyticus TaxID=3053516 RepID=UPI00257770FF|nr:AAA family ATPase [Variovorax sp. J31P216]MDM0030118.1 hypothetical protein [Variovorax sp. J31P216]
MTIDLPRPIVEQIGGFRGRGWVLPELLHWWDADKERMLLLTGDPGTGKSMLLAWLAGFGPGPDAPEERAARARLRAAVHAAHFCRASSRNITPQAFAESMANQLVQALPGFADALVQSLSDRVQIVGSAHAGVAAHGSTVSGVTIGRLEIGGLGAEAAFDRTFVAPLKALPPGPPLLLLVDALDEARADDSRTLVDLLSRLDDLPPRVRLLATSRDDPRVLKHYRDVPRLALDGDAAAGADDIRRYVAERLADAGIVAAAAAAFADRLAEHSKRVFLYAVMVLDELLAGSASAAALDSYALPEKLAGLYHGFLNRELGRDERRWFDTYEPLLGLIAVAQGDGLRAAQLSRIAGSDVREALRHCKQYLNGTLPDGPFRVFHKSFADFLLEPDEGNPDYRIDATKWHGRIAMHYLGAWRGGAGTEPDDYGLGALCAHLVGAGRVDDAVTLLAPPWMQLRQARAGDTFGEVYADIEVVTRAAEAQPQTSTATLAGLRTAAFAVHEQVASYGDEDLVLLWRLGRSAEAAAHARMRSTAAARADSLRRLLGAAPDLAPALADDAHAAAAAIGGGVERARAQQALVLTLLRTLPSAATLDPLRQTCAALRDVGERGKAEQLLVETLVAAGRLDEAETLASAIDDDTQCAFALQSVAVGRAEAGQWGQARALVARMPPASSTSTHFARIAAEALSGIALAMARAGHADAAAAFAEAELASCAIADDYDRHDALHDLAVALVQSGDTADATRVALTIDDWRRERALLEVVYALTDRGDIDAARSLLPEFRDEEEDWQGFARGSIAVAIGRGGRFEEAQVLAGTLEPEACAHAMLQVADGVDEAVDVEPWLHDAVALAESLQGAEQQSLLRHVMRVRLHRGDHDGAAADFARLHAAPAVAAKPQDHAAALAAMAAALTGVGHPGAAAALARARRSIDGLDNLWRDSEERALAEALVDVGCFDDARSVLSADRGDLQRGKTWMLLARRLHARGENRDADAAFDAALAVIRRIGNPSARDDDLVELVAGLEAAGRDERMESVARLVEDKQKRSAALTRVALRHAATDPDRVGTLLRECAEIALGSYGDSQRSDALATVVAASARCRRFEESWSLMLGIADDLARVRAVAALARWLAAAGDPRGEALLDEGERIAATPADRASQVGWWEARQLRDSADRKARGAADAGASLALLREAGEQALEIAGTPWSGWFWKHPEYRARSLFEMVLAAPDEPRRARLFGLVLENLRAVEHDNPRGTALLAVVRKLIRAGRRDMAESALQELHVASPRERAIDALVQAHLDVEAPDAALRIARWEASDYRRRHLLRTVAAGFARASRILDALRVIEEQTLDGYAHAVADALAAWRNAPPDAASAALRAVVDVAAWVRSDWRELQEAVFAPAPRRRERPSAGDRG